MNIPTLRERYFEASGTVSDVSRQLCFAGIAIIWMLRVGEGEKAGVKFEEQLLRPLGALILSLALDLLQYLYKAAVWGWMARRKESKGISDKMEFRWSPYFNWPTLFFFWGKAACCILGLGMLLRFIAAALIKS